jgi:hypothetical protein
MPDAPLAIRQKLEAAARAYLEAKITADGTATMTALDVRLRQEVTQIKFPRIVVEAMRAPAFEDMNELYMVDFRAYLGTHTSERDSLQVHADRTGKIAEWFADRDAFVAFCNNPEISGVVGLVVHDILLQDEEGEQTGEHWIDLLNYLIPCQIINEA